MCRKFVFLSFVFLVVFEFSSQQVESLSINESSDTSMDSIREVIFEDSVPRKTRRQTIDRSINLCELAADPGHCEAFMPRYYYDSITGGCKQFIYGGCNGNRNNFLTTEECQKQCSKNNI